MKTRDRWIKEGEKHDDTFDWIHAGPSRRLRKAYGHLQAIERQMEHVTNSNPCPDHAPTSCRIISRQLRELQDEQYRVLKRIGNLQGIDR